MSRYGVFLVRIFPHLELRMLVEWKSGPNLKIVLNGFIESDFQTLVMSINTFQTIILNIWYDKHIVISLVLCCLLQTICTAWKCTYSELFWSAFYPIWTEYGEIICICPYSVGMRENADQNNSEYVHFSRSVVSLWQISCCICKCCINKLFLKEVFQIVLTKTKKYLRALNWIYLQRNSSLYWLVFPWKVIRSFFNAFRLVPKRVEHIFAAF